MMIDFDKKLNLHEQLLDNLSQLLDRLSVRNKEYIHNFNEQCEKNKIKQKWGIK